MVRFATALVFLATASACGTPSNIATGDEQRLIDLDPALEAAATANLKRIAKEIDAQHMANYAQLPTGADPTFDDTIAKSFLEAVKLEYQAKPELLKRRVQMLASMVFFSAPEVVTDPAIGHLTPFHGLDNTAFENLMTNEDFVFESHMQANAGSPNGVRPFSVCETKYLIDITTGKVADPAFVAANVITNYDAYATAFGAYAANCAPADLTEWYNFRGLGGLRPSWLESNYNDRVLRRMLRVCKTSTPENQVVCAQHAEDRLAYRDRKNVAMALRQMMWDTTPESSINSIQDGEYMSRPNNAGIFLEDTNGDNIAEWLAPGSAKLLPKSTLRVDGGASVTVSDDGASIIKADGTTQAIKEAQLSIQGTSQFGAELNLTITFADDTTLMTKPGFGALQPVTRVMPGWQASFASKPDLGLSTLMTEGDCTGDRSDPATCPLVKRFYSLIDRHETFYQTYSAFDPKSQNVSSQPSPLVACSVTLRASHHWDRAGTPPGGTAGFIYLMRIPFAQILSGDVRSIDTLGRSRGDLKSGPSVIKVQDIVNGTTQLDMNLVWLDIATLSSNAFSSEHEISKFGTVPAGQIEGVLVIRRPTAMGPDPTMPFDDHAPFTEPTEPTSPTGPL